MILSTLRNEPIASTLPNEPIDPIERIDPTDPIDMNEFLHPIHKMELVEAMLHLDDDVNLGIKNTPLIYHWRGRLYHLIIRL